MVTSADISEVLLRDLYEQQGLSVAEIAQRLNYPAPSLRALMKGWGIPMRSRSEAMKLKRAKDPDRLVYIPADELERLYRVERLSTLEIAERYRCSPGTVQNRLRQYGIPRLPAGRERVEISKELLEDLYIDQKLSMRAVAQQVGCDHSTVRNKLEEYGLRQRPYAESNQIYPRYDFDGDSVEKAYLIGFRLGDLHVRMMGEAGKTIVVEGASSRQEQRDLLIQLFGPYGHVYVSSLKSNGDINLVFYLNMSFDFLLPKNDAVPNWVQSDEIAGAAFAAGYIDAEGSFFVTQGLGRFAVSSYDGGILTWLYQWVANKDVVCPAPRRVGRAGQVRPNGTAYRKDLWTLSVNRKASLLRLTELLEPYLQHAKRRRDMETVRSNVLARNARRLKQATS